MERKEIEEKVREFLIDDLEIDEENLAPEALLKDDLGIDSLDFVDIVVIILSRKYNSDFCLFRNKRIHERDKMCERELSRP